VSSISTPDGPVMTQPSACATAATGATCSDPQGCEPCHRTYNPLGLSPAHRTYCLAHGVPAIVAAAWMTVGISAPENFCDLHVWGAEPAVALAWTVHTYPGQVAVVALSRHQDEFTGLFETLSGDITQQDGPCGIGFDPSLINAVLTVGGTRDDVAAWRELDMPTERVRLLVAAGITAAEAADPAVGGADEQALNALVALRR